MFPAMCRKPPCMNSEVNIISHVAGWLPTEATVTTRPSSLS